ncbi:MAG: c-type cytochrome domain-containing protein [Chitinophagaceae bacterium]
MQRVKNTAQGILVGALIFMIFILAFAGHLHIPSWLKIAGRMHPMFLHFPIVLLLLSFLSLWIPFHEAVVWKWFEGVRLIAALSAVITAIMGLLLSVEEERSGSVLQWHKWSGVAVALSATVFYVFDSYFVTRRSVGKIFTVLGSVLIFATGHWGADLTHGENYLLAPISADKKVPVEQAVIFDDVIKPVLNQKCVSCHGEASVKGGLLLDNIKGILKGGKTGPLFIPGKPELSLLIRRIHLPEQDKKHMPPRLKPQLAEDEATLLYAWVRSGALLDKKLTTLPIEDSFRIVASRFLGAEEADFSQTLYGFKPADAKTIKSLNNNYRVVEPLNAGSPALAVRFYGRTMYSSKALEDVLTVKQQVTELNLARMPVKDGDLKLISELPNLARLNLNYSDISDKGIGQLSSLKNLQSIALAGTSVTNTSLKNILSLPKLTSVFIWDTRIDSTQVSTMRTMFPRLRIETGFMNDGRDTIALSPPLIATASGFFDTSMRVKIKHPFKGAAIRYTIDGSVPDSVKGELYKDPIRLTKNATVIARAFKDGWFGSRASQSEYIKKGLKPDSIELITPPDPTYRTAKSSLLTDLSLGPLEFRNEEWLGYHKNDAGYYLYFNNAVTVRSVLFHLLQNTGAHIFPPVKLDIWVGMEKGQLKPIGSLTPRMPKKNEDPLQVTEELEFAPQQVKAIRILVRRLNVLPSWHKEKGKPAWVFLSEIVVN